MRLLMSILLTLFTVLNLSEGKKPREQSDYTDYYYTGTVSSCSKSDPKNTTRHAKITLSYTNLKDDPNVIMIGTYAKLLLSIYREGKVIDSGDVIQTFFAEDLNKTMDNKMYHSYYKFGSMGWVDILIFDRIDFNFTWSFPNNKLDFDTLNGGLLMTDSTATRFCLNIRDVLRYNYDGKSLQFTLFYICLVVIQISAIIATIGLVQFLGCPYIKTIPRLSLMHSWILDFQLLVVTLFYLPCFIYAFIGQMFIVLFSMIASNPHYIMEGEFVHMSIRKKIFYGVFGTLSSCLLFYLLLVNPNMLPAYSLSMYFYAIIDNFVNYSKEFKYVYICGIYFPKTLLVFYIFHMPNTIHMGPSRNGDLWILGLVFLGLALVLAFQSIFHPRFYIRTNYERELLKLVPKGMLLEELLKDRAMTDDDVCGICLEPFQVDLADQIRGIELGPGSVMGSVKLDSDLGSRFDDDIKDQKMKEGKTNEPSTPSKKTKKGDAAIIDKTNCNHIFHRSCLRAWTEKNNNCPICRHTVVSSL